MLYVSKKISIFAVPNHVAEARRVEVCGWAILYTGVYCTFVSTCRNPENSNVSQKQSNGTPQWCIISVCALTFVAKQATDVRRQKHGIYACVGLRRCSSSTDRAISGASTQESGSSTAPRFVSYN